MEKNFKMHVSETRKQVLKATLLPNNLKNTKFVGKNKKGVYYAKFDGETVTGANKVAFLANVHGYLSHVLTARAGAPVILSGQMFSHGNTKCGLDCLIWNNESAHNCTSDANGFCAVSAICYAKNLEEKRPLYLAANMRRENMIKHINENELFVLVSVYLFISPNRIHEIRQNEAGDYTDQNIFNKCYNVSARIYKAYGIRTYAYTCNNNIDFTHDSNILQLCGSNFGINHADKYFFAVDKKKFKEVVAAGENICNCSLNHGICPTCGKCKDKNVTGVIYVRFHN